MNENKKILPRAILVGITLPDGTEAETEASLIELGRLVKTLGYDVASTLTQRRGAVGGGLVLGEGKLKALAERTGGLGHVPKRSFAKKTKAALRREKADEEASRVASQDDLIPPEFEDDDAGDDAGDGAGGPEGAPEKKVDAVVFDCELTPSQLANLEKATGVRVKAMYGGVSMDPQIDALRKGVEVIVGTPGRLIDLLERGEMELGDIEVMVLDEADRMADMGFMPQVQKILYRTTEIGRAHV